MSRGKLDFIFWAMSPVGEGLSGGDRIFIELARNFVEMGLSIQIITWEDGVKMMQRQQLISPRLQSKIQNLNIRVLKLNFWCRMGFTVCYLVRIVCSVFEALRLSFIHKSLIINHKSMVIYSASDFWMDSLPCFILKKRFKNIKWIGTFYLAAPHPFIGFKEGGGFRLPTFKGIIYWALQQPIRLLLRNSADAIFVTSLPDVKYFPGKKCLAVKGGVDLEKIEKWKKRIGRLPKIYDAVFMGRFHPQKGVLEIIDIWKKVVEKKPDAKLIMIGDGPLMQNAKCKMQNAKLEKNIIFKGYLFDGEEKYRIFSQSRIFVHPAVYDSGGMSAAEGMAWGLPAVSFDLESLKTYYPKGVLRAKLGDLDDFSKKILLLLENRNIYKKTGSDALLLAKEQWDWAQRAREALNFLEEAVYR